MRRPGPQQCKNEMPVCDHISAISYCAMLKTACDDMMKADE